MARYLLTCPHAPEDCVPELDSVLGHSHELFSRFDWGCKGGEHVGWVVVEAANESTARMMLPMTIRNKAHVTAVTKFTPEDISSFHAGQG